MSRYLKIILISGIVAGIIVGGVWVKWVWNMGGDNSWNIFRVVRGTAMGIVFLWPSLGFSPYNSLFVIA